MIKGQGDGPGQGNPPEDDFHFTDSEFDDTETEVESEAEETPAPPVPAPAPVPVSTGSVLPFTLHRNAVQLYVGDLVPEVTEAHLMKLFSGFPSISSVHVVKNPVTGISRGYGYCNFLNASDAQRALDTQNFADVCGKPIRLMWRQRDPLLRRAGLGNTIIKNLDFSITSKDLHDNFSQLGKILSSKVATHESGVSKGYGYIHFEKVEDAKHMIEQVNGMILNGEKVVVEHFFDMNGNTIYVKNIPINMEKEKVLEMFRQCGNIAFHKFTDHTYIDAKTAKAVRNQHCILEFELMSGRERALETMPGKVVDEQPLLVMPFIPRAQAEAVKKKVAERAAALTDGGAGVSSGNTGAADAGNARGAGADLYAAVIAAASGAPAPVQPVTSRPPRPTRPVPPELKTNLFLNNIPGSYNEMALRELFGPFGVITSLKLCPGNNGVAYGFLSFSRREEADAAIKELNGRLFEAGPLYVAFHQNKNERQVILDRKKEQEIEWARMRTGGGDGSFGLDRGMRNMALSQPQLPARPQEFGMIHPGGGGAQQLQTPSRGIPVPSSRPVLLGPSTFTPRSPLPLPVADTATVREVGRHFQAAGAAASIVPPSGLRQHGQSGYTLVGQTMTPTGPAHGSKIKPGSGLYTPPHARGRTQPASPLQPSLEMSPASTDAAFISGLAQATPGARRHMLSARLLPLVEAKYPQSATEIAETLLETLDSAEVLCLLEDDDMLRMRCNQILNFFNTRSPLRY